MTESQDVEQNAEDVLKTIKDEAEVKEDEANDTASYSYVRARHSDLSFEELGAAIDRLMESGTIYEASPGRFCHI